MTLSMRLAAVKTALDDIFFYRDRPKIEAALLSKLAEAGWILFRPATDTSDDASHVLTEERVKRIAREIGRSIANHSSPTRGARGSVHDGQSGYILYSPGLEYFISRVIQIAMIEAPLELGDTLERLGARVDDLMSANNRYLERARNAERERDAWKAVAELNAMAGAAHARSSEDILDELDKAKTQNAILAERVESLEALRPHWAKGYSSDSVAAQTMTVALSGLWKLLGAEDQTDAMQKLKELVDARTADDAATDRGAAAYAGLYIGLQRDAIAALGPVTPSNKESAP